MTQNICSLSIHEDYLLCTELSNFNNEIKIQKAVEETLPFVINHETLADPAAVTRFSEKIDSLFQQHEFNKSAVNVSIPANYTILKQIPVDESIKEENYSEIIQYEFQKTWQNHFQEYNIYNISNTAGGGKLNELRALAVHKNILKFINDVGGQSNLNIQEITPAVISVEDFFRKLHPDLSQTVLLIGWQKKGYDLILMNGQGVTSYCFKAYKNNFSSIDQIDEDDLLSAFDVLVEEIQTPPALKKQIYNIQQIFVYGYFFKSEWIELLAAQTQVPIKIIDLQGNLPVTVDYGESNLSEKNIWKFFEPVSNIY